MAGSKRTPRVTRQSNENRQSRSSSGRSKRSASASEQASTTTPKKRKSGGFDDASSPKKVNKETTIIPNFQRKIINGRKYDAFCWVCHQVTEEFYCPSCFRVYHNNCLKKIKKSSNKCSCECEFTSVDGLQTCSCKPSVLKELLICALQKVTEEKRFQKKNEEKNPGYLTMFGRWPDLQENHLLWDTIDIALIIDRINLFSYKSTGEFYQDIKLISHNCYIIKGSDSEMFLKAQKFERDVKQQLSDIEACTECYNEKCAKYPQSDFFAKVCSRQHSIVWAKLKGFPFWPAKCLRLVNGHADVRFFGTHDKSLVPLAQVYKISRKNPGGDPKKPKNSTRMSTYEEAMAELSMYISNYESKFGVFHYYNDKTHLDIADNKSEKKIQQTKKVSQMDDSSIREDNDNVECSASQTSPQLNVSCLNDVVETKVPVICLEKYFDKGNEDLAENVVLMTFSTAEEDPPAEINADIIEATSESHSQLSEISDQLPEATVSSTEICNVNVPSAGVLLNTENVVCNLDDHINTNVGADSSLPVLITSTHSLNANFSDLNNETPKTSSKENELSENALKQLSENVCQMLTEDDDDDIQLITESNVTKNVEKTIGDYILKNKSLTKTLCELVLSNKPTIRNAVAQYQNTSLQFFLLMWLEANNSRFNGDEFKTFNVFYEKLCRNLEIANTQVRRLQKENAELKEKLAIQITEEERKNAFQQKITQAWQKSNIDYKNQTKMELNKVTRELEKTKNSLNNSEARHAMYVTEIQGLSSTIASKEKELVAFKQLIEDYKKTIEDDKKTIEDDKKTIEDDKKTIEDLKSKLNTYRKDLKSVECQTEHVLNHHKDKPQTCSNLKLMDMNTPLTQQQGTFLSEETVQSTSLTISECSGIIIENPNGSSTMVPQLYSQTTTPQPGPFLQFPLIPQTAAMMQSSSPTAAMIQSSLPTATMMQSSLPTATMMQSSLPTATMMQSSSSSNFIETKSSKVVTSHSSKATASRSSKVITHHSSKSVQSHSSRAVQSHSSRAAKSQSHSSRAAQSQSHSSRAALGHSSRAKHVASSSYSQTHNSTSVMRKVTSKNKTKKHK